MSDNRKYYYLMLKEGFFDREEIKIIKGMEKGDTYISIMLELYLRSLKRQGLLMMTDRIPYSLQTLASVLSRSQDEVKFAIDIFVQFELLEVLDDGSMFMADIQNFIGKSSTEGDRKRAYRNKIEERKDTIRTSGGHLSTINRTKTRTRNITTTTKEKIAVVVSFWNDTFETCISSDDAIERVATDAINSYGLTKVKEIISKYHKYLFDESCWVSVRMTLFDFLSNKKFIEKMFHATDETYLNTAKGKQKTKIDTSGDGGF